MHTNNPFPVRIYCFPLWRNIKSNKHAQTFRISMVLRWHCLNVRDQRIKNYGARILNVFMKAFSCLVMEYAQRNMPNVGFH